MKQPKILEETNIMNRFWIQTGPIRGSLETGRPSRGWSLPQHLEEGQWVHEETELPPCIRSTSMVAEMQCSNDRGQFISSCGIFFFIPSYVWSLKFREKIL